MSFILQPLLSFVSLESSSGSLTFVLDDRGSGELKDVLLRSAIKRKTRLNLHLLAASACD